LISCRHKLSLVSSSDLLEIHLPDPWRYRWCHWPLLSYCQSKMHASLSYISWDIPSPRSPNLDMNLLRYPISEIPETWMNHLVTEMWYTATCPVTLGDSPVVVFTQLLCMVVVRDSHCTHPLGFIEVTRCRYCSTHWFFHSESPLVWGWKAMERLHLMPNFALRAIPNCKVNQGSLSLIMWMGSPNHR